MNIIRVRRCFCRLVAAVVAALAGEADEPGFREGSLYVCVYIYIYVLTTDTYYYYH